MTQMLPYIIPLLLGRTFNLDKMEVGVDIFPKDVISNPVVIQNPVTETHYKIVDNTVEARDLLDVEGAFSLNVKGGMFKAGASGAYLADTYNRENTVEVAIRASYQVVTEQLPADAKPIDTWKSMGGALGTHFVRSITYGGELISGIRMECNNTRDKQRIKAALEVGGRIEVFDLGVEVEGEYMKEVAKSVESTQIKMFSSIPLSTVPNDMNSLKKALDAFPEDLRKYNDGKGVPLKMELWPLELLDPSRPSHIKNRILEANLDAFEQKFDDLVNAKKGISDWLKVTVTPLTPEQEKKVGEFYSKIENAIRPFYDVIGKLDMSKGSEQLKPANDAYGNGIPGVYYKQYMILREEIAKDQGEWTRSRGNGATYIHWGKKNCTKREEHVISGAAVGPHGYGGGSNFLCLPEVSKFGDAPINLKDASVLQGIPYKLPSGVHSILFCSTCRISARGSVQTFVGKTDCPLDWDYVYDGLLMSGSHDSMSTNFICMDKDPDVDTKSSGENPVVPDWALIAGDPNEKQFLYTCVVCAK